MMVRRLVLRIGFTSRIVSLARLLDAGQEWSRVTAFLNMSITRSVAVDWDDLCEMYTIKN